MSAWDRVRHRRWQALSLVLLAALLTTSLGLGPLYQRAMSQALAGSVLAGASADERSLRLTATDVPVGDLAAQLPDAVAPYVGTQLRSQTVDVLVRTDRQEVTTRLYAVDGLCERLELVAGECPAAGSEVLVSDRDVAVNGWAVGAQVPFTERVDGFYEDPEKPAGTLRVVGVYRAVDDAGWLGAPIVGRAGQQIEGQGVVTDDWVTAAATLRDPPAAGSWYKTDSSVAWSLDLAEVDVDALTRVGAAVGELQGRTRADAASARVDSALATLADRVTTGREQGRTTVVVLVAQLLVLVAVVLWLVLCAATDDRRSELALARLRGRGRRGARRFLLVELVPLALAGVALGALVAPAVTAVVSRVLFPVAVPLELPRDYAVAVLGAAVVVTLVVLAAARRATREPLGSLLRAVPARRGTTLGEVVAVVFSLTAVLALLTGTLDGPLATAAPTLLAVAAGLLLARVLGPAMLWLSRRLLRRGHAVAGAGVVSAVRRPAARRVLVVVVVAASLVVFCADALVTGQQNRQRAAEQDVGAPHALSVRASSLRTVTDAVAEVDPGRRHVTPVVVASTTGSDDGPTFAVDPVAFARVAHGATDLDTEAIGAPEVEPVRLSGTRLTGVVDVTALDFGGPSQRRDEVRVRALVLGADGATTTVDLAAVPRTPSAVPVDVALACGEGCVLTGLTLTTPPGLTVATTFTLRDLAADGAPVDLGVPEAWGEVEAGGAVLSASGGQADGGLSVEVSSEGALPPVLLHDWVPDPVPALVTSPMPALFEAPGLDEPVTMTRAGVLPRLPGAGPGARLVDVTGLQRRPDVDIVADRVEVWTDSAGTADAVTAALRERGALVDARTTTAAARAELDASPAAWSLALAVLVGGVGLLVAALVMLVATATTWRARASDLAALRMAGLPDRSLRRLEVLGQLPVVLAGGLVGAACGVGAAVVALPGVRQFSVVPDVDTTDFSTPWSVVVLTAALALAVLTALAVATARWTAARARLARLREAV